MDYTISVDRLIKAQNVFESFRTDMEDDRDRAGAVQAFEFCYELSWKTMKRILEDRGQEIGSPKDTFRKAALEKLIDDPERWFEFQKKRNLTAHTYDRATLYEVVAGFDAFSAELAQLITNIKQLQ